MGMRRASPQRRRCAPTAPWRGIERLEARVLLSTTWTVTSTADDGTGGTLRYAITHSAADDSITFDPSAFAPAGPHTITLSGTQLEIAHSLTISVPANAAVTVNGNSASRVFQVDAGTSVIMSGLEITGGFFFAFGHQTGEGGGIYNQGTLTLLGCAVVNNQVGSGDGTLTAGGGIGNVQGASLTVVNSTIANNSVNSGGGGSAIDNRLGTVRLINDTITGNQGGSGYFTWSSYNTDTIYNTIIAGNDAGNDIDVQFGSVTSANDLVGAPGAPGLTNGINGNIVGAASPGLAALADNGGPTPTRALLAGSPAIDAGNGALLPAGASTDQRGMPRIAGASVDIGAYEAQTQLVVDTTADGVFPSLEPMSLRQAIAIANADKGPDAITIQFSPSVFAPGAAQTITLAQPLELTNGTGKTTIRGPGGGAVTVSGNNATRVFVIDANVAAVISGITVARGSIGGASANGGGILNHGTLAVADSIFQGNYADLGGGAIYNDGKLIVSRSTFDGDQAAFFGGGIESGGTTATLAVDNSTFFAEFAPYGGAVNGSGVTFANCTLTGNSATYEGGGIDAPGGNFTLNNSIVAGNYMRSQFTTGNINGSVTGSHNLIGIAGGAGGLVNGQNGNLVGFQAALGPLGYYGGPTPTMPLLAGSRAIDAGDNALIVGTTDQRGLPRIFNGTTDIGAVESQSPPLAGDVNHDGVVNFADLLILARQYGHLAPLYELGDLNGDGSVNVADLLIVAHNYGKSAGVTSAARAQPAFAAAAAGGARAGVRAPHRHRHELQRHRRHPLGR